MKPIKRGKVKGAGFAGILSAGLGGVSTGFNTYRGMDAAGLT
jgi:hypothetical protein